MWVVMPKRGDLDGEEIDLLIASLCLMMNSGQRIVLRTC
ncbi:hypothetical protein HMPREF9058_2000 [Actinomyces sp. oral taxon 175 str. F0384]|nr:hypothetical protein HMPREF9058_2000 [Actinomyces sp. oral taxon 175 str. F0384]